MHRRREAVETLNLKQAPRGTIRKRYAVVHWRVEPANIRKGYAVQWEPTDMDEARLSRERRDPAAVRRCTGVGSCHPEAAYIQWTCVALHREGDAAGRGDDGYGEGVRQVAAAST